MSAHLSLPQIMVNNPNMIRAFQDRLLPVLDNDNEARDIVEGDIQRVFLALPSAKTGTEFYQPRFSIL